MKKYHVAYGEGGAYYAFGYETRRDAEIVLTIAQLHDPKAYIVEEACHTTNADRIRAMSDEELAKIIGVLVRHLRCLNPTCNNCDQCPLTQICDLKEDEVLDWLRKSVVDEMPFWESDCPFYDGDKCKLDGHKCRYMSYPTGRRDPEDCEWLKEKGEAE